MLIYKKLKAVRELFNLKQSDVSLAIGISQRDISQLENGDKKFIPTEYIQFLNKRGVPLDILYNDDISVDGFIRLIKQKQSYGDIGTSLSLKEDENLIKIPVLDISMAAGLNGYINNENIDIEGHIALPSSMVKKGSIYACGRAKGDSMSPTIFDSNWVILRLLDRSEWSDMPDEYIYNIVDIYNKNCLKRVKNRLNKGFIVCMSDNLDKINYPNFNLQADEIAHIWRAEWNISARMPNINETYYDRLKHLEDRVDDMSNVLKRLAR